MNKTNKDKTINIKATMVVKNGVIFLKKGSRIASIQQESLNWRATRERLLISDEGILLEDVECTSPSMAAVLVLGRRQNGWTAWKNNKNQRIDIYRKISTIED